MSVQKDLSHTPGPWRVGEKIGDYIGIDHDNNARGAMTRTFCRVTARVSWLEEALANAHLIAAAPELLDALKWAIGELKAQTNISAIAFRFADAAIAKAESR